MSTSGVVCVASAAEAYACLINAEYINAGLVHLAWLSGPSSSDCSAKSTLQGYMDCLTMFSTSQAGCHCSASCGGNDVPCSLPSRHPSQQLEGKRLTSNENVQQMEFQLTAVPSTCWLLWFGYLTCKKEMNARHVASLSVRWHRCIHGQRSRCS